MSFNRPPSYASEHSHEDMLDAYSLRDGPFSVNDIPGIATASSQTPSYSDNPWMRMKMQAIREFLNSHPDAISQLPAYMPHDTTDPVEALRRQGREQMPPPPTPAGPSRPEPPMFAPESPDAPAPANRVVNLVSRDGPTYESPYPISSDAPASDLNDAISTVEAASAMDDAPPPYKRARTESERPRSPFDSCIMDFTRDQFIEVMRRSRGFPTSFVLESGQLSEIAHGVLLDILDSYGVNGDITVQAESACADLLTRVQKRFKAPFEAEGF
ncbi:hypothetical protein KEM48_004067 [Puccinia striiformis f. sp. tritici PST-130]|nr:hypothetical protein Pst134EB_014682 [Puccinia striiformis f. sp. tritici]KAI9612831.1 hypothetical protein KEM48_004067 [Puccinia striiformis f. sp. tritici PST-130]